MEFVLMIAAAIAIGIFVAYLAIVTLKWLKNKIKEHIAKKNIKKVAVTTLGETIKGCNNQVSLEDLDRLEEEGYDTVIADVDNNGKVKNVDLVKNTGSHDTAIDKFLGEENMVVVNA